MGKVLTNVVIKYSQSGVVRQTSVDCCKPINVLPVNLVTSRVDLKRVITACICKTFVCNEANSAALKVNYMLNRLKEYIHHYAK